MQRRKWTIFITALATIIVALVGYRFLPANYEASAVVRIIPYSTNSPSYNEIMYADRVMKTYLEIGSSSVVLSAIRESLGLSPDRDISVDVEIIPDTELLRITAKDYDPVLATDVANALVSYLINDKTIRDVRITLMEPALLPEPPSVLGVVAFYVLAILVGLLGGVGLAFVLENTDMRLYEEEQVRRIVPEPLLCMLPLVSGLGKNKMLTAQFPYNQSFQRLSMILKNLAQKHHLKTILIASPESETGRSTLAANLALNLAQSGCKTLLVDADFRDPVLHQYFGLSNTTGISNLLSSGADVEDGIQATTYENLSVMTNGTLPENFNGLLKNAQQTKDILEKLSCEYDLLILDAPAYLELVDSMLLSSLVDGVLIVVRFGVTQAPSLETLYQQLELVRAHVIGVVANGVTTMFPNDMFYRPSVLKNAFGILKKIWIVRRAQSEEQVQRPAMSHEEA